MTHGQIEVRQQAGERRELRLILIEAIDVPVVVLRQTRRDIPAPRLTLLTAEPFV